VGLELPWATRAARQMVDLRRRFSLHPHAPCALSKGNDMPNPAAGLRGPTHPAEAVLLYIGVTIHRHIVEATERAGGLGPHADRRGITCRNVQDSGAAAEEYRAFAGSGGGR
jgi:hypothetical protein